MEAFIFYTLKVGFLLSLFYGVYFILLRKDTFFSVNRHFLLSGIIASLLLPFVEFTTVTYIEPTLATGSIIQPTNLTPTQDTSVNWWFIGITIYAVGVFLMMIRFLIQVLSLRRLIHKQPIQKEGKFKLIEVEKDIAPFSFLNTIVYNPALHTQEELEMIITHEKIHAHQLHTLDTLIGHLFVIFQWANPLAWWYKKSLEQNLEFIADREASNNLSCKKEYQLTLIKVSSNNTVAIVNNFYQSLIKKRIVMLNKKDSNKQNLLKTFAILPLLSVFLWSFNTTTIVKEKTTSATNSSYTYFISKDSKTVKFIINKSSSKQDLESIKKTLEDEYSVKISFSNIKRNDDGEILRIEMKMSSEKSNANYAIENDAPINPITITYNSKTKKINISQSENGNIHVWSSKKSKKKIVEIDYDEDEDSDGEHNISIVTSGKTKIITKKDKKGNIITEEIHGNDDDNIFKIHTNDKKTFAFTTNTGGKEPLFFIDGKKVEASDMKNLDSDDIEEVNVYKGEKAKKKFGTEAKNGVVEIITKNK